jgi:pimeloyl-ACP methyl ester carboxylesterase
MSYLCRLVLGFAIVFTTFLQLFTLPPAAPPGTKSLTSGFSILTQSDVPRFERAECPFTNYQIPQGERVECGYLVVLEDRTQPAGRTIRLAVAILKSFGVNPAPDPVVFLSGGPGVPSLDNINFWLVDDRSLRAKRDLILIDQRGTGYSQPDMRCPELDMPDVLAGVANLPPEEAGHLYVSAALNCRNRLLGEGVNLAAYNSSASAADLADLRQVLGHSQWNLYGLSYGGRLVLTTMREQPQGIRSAILDSPRTVGVKNNEVSPTDTYQAFQVLFAGCAADAGCRSAFPDLERAFNELVDRLNASPVSVAVVDAKTGAKRQQLINGDQLVSGGFEALYRADLIPFLPLAIDQINSGNYDVLAGFASMLGQGSSESAGMGLSVRCHEELPFNDLAKVRAEMERYPRFQDYFARYMLSDFAVCAEWGAGKGLAIEAEPVRSDIPTLVMSGEYDPIHPAWWGKLAADNLSHSYHYTLPGYGHGVTFYGECQTSIRDSFIDSPEQAPDTSCIGDMRPPAFVTDVYVNSGVLGFAMALPNPDPFMLGLVVFIAILFLSALIGWPLAYLIKRRRKSQSTHDAAGWRFSAIARWLAVLVIVLDLIFFVSLILLIIDTASTDEPMLLFGLPPVAAPLFVIPLMAGALTIVLIVLGMLAWWGRYWSTASRLHYSLVVLAAAGFIGLLAHWGLL